MKKTQSRKHIYVWLEVIAAVVLLLAGLRCFVQILGNGYLLGGSTGNANWLPYRFSALEWGLAGFVCLSTAVVLIYLVANTSKHKSQPTKR